MQGSLAGPHQLQGASLSQQDGHKLHQLYKDYVSNVFPLFFAPSAASHAPLDCHPCFQNSAMLSHCCLVAAFGSAYSPHISSEQPQESSLQPSYAQYLIVFLSLQHAEISLTSIFTL